MPPRGKYYVVDSGYANTPKLQKKHAILKISILEVANTLKQLFKYYHFFLRNVIERCFDVLKTRFPMLKHMPPFALKKQAHIVIACYILHNFIRIYSGDDALFEEYQNYYMGENVNGVQRGQEREAYDLSSSQTQAMDVRRDGIANKFLNDIQARLIWNLMLYLYCVYW
ncbi:unnamed protein product [Linum trigynum]|uniref:DDE Tnp4 domain-containing protein n=1 Tax=Linum trigynum TaxID=586398 RepID=A0AAV2FQE3_9ROSI